MATTAQGKWVPLAEVGGRPLRGWLAEAEGRPRGAVVIVQEIYGVNAHIQSVVCNYAAAGYSALAPSFFDLLEDEVVLDYGAADTERGRQLVARLGMDNALRTVAAARDRLSDFGSVAVVGYCWGGAVAYLSATRLGLPAVSYYGRLVEQYLHERPQAPLQFHFGERDELIPAASVQRVAAAFPDLPLYTYPAGHAFNRLGDAHGHPPSAELAKRRALEFLARHLSPYAAGQS